MLISHWSRIFPNNKDTLLILNPSAFQNGMKLENRMKIEGAMSKNVNGCVFLNFFAKTLGGYFGAPKMDFNDSKGKNECTLIDILSFWG